MAEVKECCRVWANLKEEPSGKKDVTIYRCQVCKCRHIKATLTAGHLSLRT